MQNGKKKNLARQIVAWGLVGGLLVTSFLPLAGSIREAFTDSGNASSYINSVLAPVPVFTVADTEGRPLLRDLGEAGKVGYFFLEPGDVKIFKEEVGEEFPSKVVAIGLDEAVRLVGSKPADGERYELVASGREVGFAKDMIGERRLKQGVPLFWVEGLAFAGQGKEKTVYPLYFGKEQLESLIKQAREKNLNLSLGDIQVSELMQTIREMKAGVNNRLRSVIFMPFEEAVKYSEEISRSAEKMNTQKTLDQ